MSRAEPLRIEVPGMDELIRVASSLHVSIINVDEERGIAFVFLAPIATLNPIVYYARVDRAPQGRYAHFNRVTGRIRFSDEISAEPNEVSIPVIRVKAEGLLP